MNIFKIKKMNMLKEEAIKEEIDVCPELTEADFAEALKKFLYAMNS